MPRARHLILFARAPRFGAVKTRLARDIGRLEAWRFYRRTLGTTLARLGRDPRWTTSIAVTPDSFARAPIPDCPKGVRRIPQGRGDLGQRMANAFARVFAEGPPGPAVLIGVDIPGVRADHIAEALRRLESFEAVFGPATDGGFWLVGFKRRPPRDIFKNVRWSTPHALSMTLANARTLNVAPPVETLADVDDGEAFAREKERHIHSR